MQVIFQPHYVASRWGSGIMFSMTKKVRSRLKRRRRNYLAEWRKYRNNMTQPALADRVGMSVSNISQLERGLQGYSEDGLEALAEALQCEPWHILNVNPLDEDSVWSLWERAEPAQRQVILDVARNIVSRKAG